MSDEHPVYQIEWPKENLVEVPIRKMAHFIGVPQDRIAEAPEMYALLKEIEWTTSMFNSNPICPSCDRGEEGGHETDCKLAAVLKAVEGDQCSSDSKA